MINVGGIKHDAAQASQVLTTAQKVMRTSLSKPRLLIREEMTMVYIIFASLYIWIGTMVLSVLLVGDIKQP